MDNGQNPIVSITDLKEKCEHKVIYATTTVVSFTACPMA